VLAKGSFFRSAALTSFVAEVAFFGWASVEWVVNKTEHETNTINIKNFFILMSSSFNDDWVCHNVNYGVLNSQHNKCPAESKVSPFWDGTQ
jgi:hypothetical protein